MCDPDLDETIMIPPMVSWAYFALPPWQRKHTARADTHQAEFRCSTQLLRTTWVETNRWFGKADLGLADMRKYTPRICVTGSWVFTVNRGMDGKFERRNTRWALHSFEISEHLGTTFGQPHACKALFSVSISACNHSTMEHHAPRS